MERDEKYYLRKSPEELRNIELKKEIIYNENHYIFVWFCQQASQEQLEALLDENGIEILGSAERLKDKLIGLVTSGNQMNFFENIKMCELILETDSIDYLYNLNIESSRSFAKFVYENKREKISDIYAWYSGKNQIQLLEDFVLEEDEKRKMLKSSKKNAAEFFLKKYSIDMSELSIGIIEHLLKEGVTFPSERITRKLIQKIVGITDVNRYRMLLDIMEENHDVSEIERERKKLYEREIASIGEDGLLENFRRLKDKINAGEGLWGQNGIDDIELFLNEDVVYEIMFSKDKEKTIKRINDYYISNMIIDYFLEDTPTNVLKNINSMLRYNTNNSFLESEDRKTYEMLQNIDSFDAHHKKMLFETLKDKYGNMVAKFYDDFSKAENKMVKQINESILTEKNIKEFYNEELSKQAGVPVYCLTGQPFKCLIRNIGVYKSSVLERRNLDFVTDGSSFSIDSSEMLQTFGNPNETYTFAYSKIPENQLIHIFPTDSFSRYDRDSEKDIPLNKNATERVIELYTPEELTSTGKEYNEVIIAVPNVRKDNEFEASLEKPKPFAIYCYNQIYDSDVESAKRLGIGIIAVDTRCYNIDKSKRLSQLDTIGKDRGKYSYLTRSNEEDERMNGILDR